MALQQIETSIQQATALFQAGRYTDVIPICETVLALDNRVAFAWNLHGLAQQALGNAFAASQNLRQALALEPGNATFHNNYGVCLQQAGKTLEAQAAFRRAIGFQPRYSDAYANLYLSLLRGKDYAAAFAVIDAAMKHNCLAWEVFLQAIQQAVDLALATKAKEWIEIGLQRVAQEGKDVPAAAKTLGELHRLQGQLFLNAGLPEKAIAEFQVACELVPTSDVLWSEQAIACKGIMDVGTAQKCIRKAQSLNVNRLAWRLQAIGSFPFVLGSEQELLERRRQLEASLDELLDSDCHVDLSELLIAGFMPPYQLGFHGLNDRPIKEKFAAVWRKAIRPVAQPRLSQGKPRIGFLVTQEHEPLFLRIMQKIVEHLAESQEVDVVVLGSHTIAPRLTSAFAHSKVQILPFLNHPLRAARQIAAAGCHVIHHFEIGSDIINYALPFFRLAPIQCTSWAIQSTTGMSEVDYYLSSDRVEVPEAQDFYTEKLIRLPSLLTVQISLERPANVTRAQLGLPEQGTLYVCPQTLLKLHPRQDALFRRILEGDPRGYLVLKHLRHPALGQALLKRFQQTMPEMLNRIVLLPWLSTDDYRRLLCVADVILDSVVFSAGSSSYDIFSFNKPLVTCPGQFFPSRFASACYRGMGFTELIAEGDDSYVELALKLGHDGQYRAWCEEELGKRTPNWFAATQALLTHREVLSEWALAIR
jgi:predicted O-linked N-acetylglucosamine transferase (SPINDLY family)